MYACASSSKLDDDMSSEMYLIQYICRCLLR